MLPILDCMERPPGCGARENRENRGQTTVFRLQAKEGWKSWSMPYCALAPFPTDADTRVGSRLIGRVYLFRRVCHVRRHASSSPMMAAYRQRIVEEVGRDIHLGQVLHHCRQVAQPIHQLFGQRRTGSRPVAGTVFHGRQPRSAETSLHSRGWRSLPLGAVSASAAGVRSARVLRCDGR